MNRFWLFSSTCLDEWWRSSNWKFFFYHFPFNFRRSRSVTPQSHTGTPPQSAQPNNLMNNPNINSILSSATSHLGNNGNHSSSNQRTELPGPPLNYSEMMRTLAAKYNNSNEWVLRWNIFLSCVRLNQKRLVHYQMFGRWFVLKKKSFYWQASDMTRHDSLVHDDELLENVVLVNSPTHLTSSRNKRLLKRY